MSDKYIVVKYNWVAEQTSATQISKVGTKARQALASLEGKG